MANEPQPIQRTALVAGGSGLTGGELLRALLRGDTFSRVNAVSRRPLFVEHPRLVNRVSRLEELGSRMGGATCTDAFCCIGAAGAKRATSAELQKVDLELTLAFAGVAKSAGAKRFVVISAARADGTSDKPFQKVKGRLELALRDMKFDALDIMQPGRILGVRANQGLKDVLERGFLPMVSPLLKGKLEALRGIDATTLAAAMLGAALSQRRGITRYSGEALEKLARVDHM
jgi:uncharacterized protein YbjT (DUF2867 family)